MEPGSAFSVAGAPSALDLEAEGRVRYLMVNGRQDDGLWGPLGALWLSEDGSRGGFLVTPWAVWEGSEFVRGYRGAIGRGWTPGQIYRYWQHEVWRGSYAIDDEQSAPTLALLFQIINAL
jgi:hypothetical protein